MQCKKSNSFQVAAQATAQMKFRRVCFHCQNDRGNQFIFKLKCIKKSTDEGDCVKEKGVRKVHSTVE